MRKEDIPVSLIRSAGLRATGQRLALISLLMHTRAPQSINDIAEALPEVDMVTIYRMISTFVKKGILREVDLRQGRTLYELNDTEHDHHHVVCTSCDRVEDFEGCGYESITKRALNQVKGFARIESHSIELFGLCNRCVRA